MDLGTWVCKTEVNLAYFRFLEVVHHGVGSEQSRSSWLLGVYIKRTRKNRDTRMIKDKRRYEVVSISLFLCVCVCVCVKGGSG